MPDAKVGVSARSLLPSLTTRSVSVASVETPPTAVPVMVIRNENPVSVFAHPLAGFSM